VDLNLNVIRGCLTSMEDISKPGGQEMWHQVCLYFFIFFITSVPIFVKVLVALVFSWTVVG